MSLDFKLKRLLRGLGYPKPYWLPAWMGPLDPQEIGELFGSKPDPEELYAEAIAAWNHPSAKNDVDRTIQFYVRLYLQDDILVKTDRASMMHGLEARCPFLDMNVVDFARRIPSSYKLRGGVTKYILKEAVRGLIPDRVIDRPKKGFGIPIGNWFKNGDLDPRLFRHPEGTELVLDYSSLGRSPCRPAGRPRNVMVRLVAAELAARAMSVRAGSGRSIASLYRSNTTKP